MAYITDIKCNKCNKTKTEVRNNDYPNTCQDCLKKESSKARRVHLSGLKGLTIE